MLIKLLST